MMNQAMEAILNKLRILPTLPKVYYRITAMLDDPQVSAADVTKEVAKDPSLTTKMLRHIKPSMWSPVTTS
mgnify:CR=1 FL=1